MIFFCISNPVISVTNVNDAQFSTKLLAQTTLRNVLGTKTLSEILSAFALRVLTPLLQWSATVSAPSPRRSSTTAPTLGA